MGIDPDMTKFTWENFGYGRFATMAINRKWSGHLVCFPGYEEVKRTEKQMSNAYVVPELSMTSLQQIVRQSQVFPVCMLKGEISQ